MHQHSHRQLPCTIVPLNLSRRYCTMTSLSGRLLPSGRMSVGNLPYTHTHTHTHKHTHSVCVMPGCGCTPVAPASGCCPLTAQQVLVSDHRLEGPAARLLNAVNGGSLAYQPTCGLILRYSSDLSPPNCAGVTYLMRSLRPFLSMRKRTCDSTRTGPWGQKAAL